MIQAGFRNRKSRIVLSEAMNSFSRVNHIDKPGMWFLIESGAIGFRHRWALGFMWHQQGSVFLHCSFYSF